MRVKSNVKAMEITVVELEIIRLKIEPSKLMKIPIVKAETNKRFSSENCP